MGTKSQFFRAFIEGQTISDGRTVTPEMIDQAAETFNAETYPPGINIEHLAGFSPEPPLHRYGDVISVRTQTYDFTMAKPPSGARSICRSTRSTSSCHSRRAARSHSPRSLAQWIASGSASTI